MNSIGISKEPVSILIPRPLQPGDRLGVVAASGPPAAELLSDGLKFFEEKGFSVVKGCHLHERNGYLAGTDEQRSEDLNCMLRDPEVRGILFARGGYGLMRLLDRLDHTAVMRDPKPLVGMSDVTALHLSLYSQCGLVTLAGPMIAGQVGQGLDPISEESLVRALTGPIEGHNLFDGVGDSIRVLRAGQVRAPLVGGCLSLVTAIVGTRHCPDFRGKVLILEDVNEAAYRVDRMLTQLKLAGILQAVEGIILGYFLGPDGEDLGKEVETILLELMDAHPVPVVSGFPHGHRLPNLTVPIGRTVELDTEKTLLRVCD
ncbi:MAG: LD-carboxypeptidase [Desulfomonile tiedjei]|nr:LD-carboxypeptidase [Desulfomonile tiedjei]